MKSRSILPISDSVKRRFWNLVDKKGEDECWLWTGRTYKHGYGRFSVHGIDEGAHRIALMIATGKEIKGLACHKCNVPLCCSPKHLYDGTYKSNMEDMIEKNGGKWPDTNRQIGERNGSALLKEWEVIEIIKRRKEPGANEKAIAMEMGVHRTTIRDIWNGRRWKHLPR